MNPTEKRRHGVNEVIPGRLYQRANFLTWPYMDKKDMLSALSINVVVNLWRPIDSDMADHRRGTKHNDALYINWHMATDTPPSGADDLVRFLGALMRKEAVVLVHCEAGRNRSAWLCARLVGDLLNVDWKVALATVQRAVPKAAINRRLKKDVEQARPLIYTPPFSTHG